MNKICTQFKRLSDQIFWLGLLNVINFFSCHSCLNRKPQKKKKKAETFDHPSQSCFYIDVPCKAHSTNLTIIVLIGGRSASRRKFVCVLEFFCCFVLFCFLLLFYLNFRRPYNR